MGCFVRYHPVKQPLIFSFHKRYETSWLLERLLASQESLCLNHLRETGGIRTFKCPFVVEVFGVAAVHSHILSLWLTSFPQPLLFTSYINPSLLFLITPASENGGSMSLRNVVIDLQIYTAPKPKSSTTTWWQSPWEPHLHKCPVWVFSVAGGLSSQNCNINKCSYIGMLARKERSTKSLVNVYSCIKLQWNFVSYVYINNCIVCLS
jgi:hypothetical protein